MGVVAKPGRSFRLLQIVTNPLGRRLDTPSRQWRTLSRRANECANFPLRIWMDKNVIVKGCSCKNCLPLFLFAMLLLCLMWLSTPAMAMSDKPLGIGAEPSDSSEARQPSPSSGDEPERSTKRNGSYLELGLSLVHLRTAHPELDPEPLQIGPTFQGVFYFRSFFLEATAVDGLNVGFTLHQNDRSSFEFIAASVFGEVNLEDKTQGDTEAARNDRLFERNSLLIGSGFRFSHYSGRTLLRFRVLADVHESRGYGLVFELGHWWQYGNWDVRALIGASWVSDNVADYLFGIDADEATSSMPAIEIDQIGLVELGVSASYPLTRNWVIRNTALVARYDGSITRSSLVDRPYESALSTSIHYVF